MRINDLIEILSVGGSLKIGEFYFSSIKKGVIKISLEYRSVIDNQNQIKEIESALDEMIDSNSNLKLYLKDKEIIYSLYKNAGMSDDIIFEVRRVR